MPPSSAPPGEISPAALVRIEAAALEELAVRLDGPMRPAFEAAVELLLGTADGGRRAILTGIGKSGHIARKIAATLRSTGTPAHFLHPAEALHGDAGMVTSGDTVVALSLSGETAELLQLLPFFGRLGTPVIALCGSATSTLARGSRILLDTNVTCEACPHNLAPTASTTLMLALGDALALTVSSRRGFTSTDFADLHPGGHLGERLARVRDRMHTGDAIPSVAPETPLPELIHEMSRKKLGMTAVRDGPRLLGIISDGDLRRLLERDGAAALTRNAAEVMHPNPLTIGPAAFASAALALMEERKITSLLVVSPNGELEGVLHLHDLWTPSDTSGR